MNYIDSSLLIKAINTDHFTFSLIISISLLTTLKNRALIWWFEVISITPGSSINHLYEVGIFGPQWKRKSGQNLHSWTWMLSSLALVFLKFSISTRSYILLSGRWDLFLGVLIHWIERFFKPAPSHLHLLMPQLNRPAAIEI